MNDDGPNISPATLSGVPETLLIPLAARLLATRLNPDLGFADPAADAVGAALGFDPQRFADDRATMRGSIVRGAWFDGVARRFLDVHPQGLAVSIGSGLDTRANRVAPPPGAAWVDIDFPEVAALRDALVPALPNVRTVAGDGTDVAAWADAVGWTAGRPVLVMAEGVSMYLDPARGEAWIRGIVDAARRKGSTLTLALDLASPFMARHGRRNRSVAKTTADFAWGVETPSDLTRIAPGLEVAETFDVARRSGIASRVVNRLHRLMTGRPIYLCTAFVAE